MRKLDAKRLRESLSRVTRSARAFYFVWSLGSILLAFWVVFGPRKFLLHHGMLAAGLLWTTGIGVITLVTAWIRRGQDVLASSEAYFRATWEQSRDALFLLKDDVFVECNPATEDLFGVDRDAILGQSPWSLSPSYQRGGGSSRAEARRRLQAALDGERQLFEWRHSRLDGTVIECEVALGRVDLDREAFVLASVRDVSERRKREERRRLLERAVEQAAESVIVTDPNGTILYVNPAFREITGYTSDEAIGQTPRILKSGHHGDDFYGELWETICSGEVWRGTFVNLNKERVRYQQESVIGPVVDESGKIVAFVAVCRDVTRQRELEERIQLAERMETVGQMAAIVAHDFNNLLMAVQGATHLIELHNREDEFLLGKLKVISHSVDRGTELIRRLLATSKRRVGTPQYIELSGALQTLRESVEATLREDIRVELALPSEPIVVRIDPVQLEQVVLNLASNARDAMPKGGRLFLKLEKLDVDDASAALQPWVRPGRYARLSVADTGVGMDLTTKARVFEPFFSTKGDQGTGLGLATVYGIIETANGFVDVDSELGEGTTFKVHIPLCDREGVVAEEKSDRRGNGLTGGSESVLLVEDSSLVLESVKGMLEALGYSVVAAQDGETALDIVREHAESIDVVLTDVVLPGLGGGELAEEARRVAPELPFVFASGYTEDVVQHYIDGLPGTACLEKPFSLVELARTLRGVLDG